MTVKELEGLYVIGTLESVKPAEKKDGTVLKGLIKLEVNVGRDWPERCEFPTWNEDLEQPTNLGEQYDKGELEKLVGAPVAVKVNGRTREGSKYINYRAVRVEPLGNGNGKGSK